MRRHGNLWQEIITPENIRLAYEKAAKGKGTMRNVIKFRENLNENLELIRQSLISRTFHTSRYSTKIVHEPKERIIYVLPFNPDRIVQHALMDVLAPIWEGLFINDSYACREGKGIHMASDRTMEFVRRNKYCLKCDIHHFYPSIDHEILLKIITHKIKDKDTLWLLSEIIHSFPGGKNAPIGNYTSQWFGNLYLNELDHYVKETLHSKDYIRYCDDFLLFGNDKNELNRDAKLIDKFINKNLKITYSKCDLFQTQRGVDFLGYRHFPDYILLRKSTAKRMMKKMKRLPDLYRSGSISAEYYQSFIGSIWGWLKHADSYNLRLVADFERLRKVVA
jgi:hypothetical protein